MGLGSMLMEDPTGEVNGVCWKLMAALCVVIVALAGALVKVAKFAWDERMARLDDHRAIESAVDKQKEGKS